uniref:Uncharacterized protein n=1 Tax=Erpetoichthys calabaricus TaxID=27687 RepID=A0A8C4TDW2_ERPCA
MQLIHKCRMPCTAFRLPLVERLETLTFNRTRSSPCLSDMRLNVDESKDFFKRKIDFLTKQIEKIQPALQEKHAMKQVSILE